MLSECVVQHNSEDKPSVNPPVKERSSSLFNTDRNASVDGKEEKKPEVYPYVSTDEILRNASVIRLHYYDNLPYNYVNYSYGSTFCQSYGKPIPATTAKVLKRSFMTLSKK